VALWRLPRPDFHRLVDTDFQDTPLRVTAYMLAKSPKRPSAPEAPTVSFPPPPLRLLPGGANPVPGRDFHPQSTSAFSRRTRCRLLISAVLIKPRTAFSLWRLRKSSIIARPGVNQ
jgi:hypothetical protein